MTGILIELAGGEGSGKSTQAKRLHDTLTTIGATVLLTREPGGGTLTGQSLREMLLNAPPGAIPARAEAMLFAADRAIHTEHVIRPALADDLIVICDRHTDSSIAYQGHGRQLGAGIVEWLSSWATANLTPDLVILLDIDPIIGLYRAATRSVKDSIETQALEFHQRVRQGFLSRAVLHPYRYLVLDATQPEDLLATVIAARVTHMLSAQCALQPPGKVFAPNDSNREAAPL